MDPAKLKVVELRAALGDRGLDVKGNKPVLVERLRKALEEEIQKHDQDKSALHTENIEETASKEAPEKVAESTRSSQPPRTPSRASRSSSMVTPTKISTRNASRTATTPYSLKQSSPNKSQYVEKAREVLATISESTSEEPVVQQEKISKLSPEKYREEQKDIASDVVQNEIHVQTPSGKTRGEEAKHIDVLEGNRCETNVSQVPATEPSEKSSTIEHVDQFSRTQGEHGTATSNVDKINKVQKPSSRALVDETKDTTKLEEKTEIKENVDIDKVQDDNVEEDVEDKNLVEKENIEHVEDMYNVKDHADIPEVEESTHVTSDQIDRTCDILKDEGKTINDHSITQEDKMDVSDNLEDMDEKMDDTNNPQNEQDVKMAEIKQKDAKLDTDQSNQKDSKDRKRKRSPSPVKVCQMSLAPFKPEEEPEFDEYAVTLSYYDSDLNLVISEDGFYSATPMHNDDLCHMWAGTRASYGFTNGKLFYEVKITENCPTTAQDKEHMLRVGWSTLDTSMQLGEERFSYAYTSTGKKGTDKEFTDYGASFNKNDVVGCYLDLMPDDTVELFYTLNGMELGSAFSISKEELGGRPLFPHVLSKNCTFVCNFGQEEAWCECPLYMQDYVFVGNVQLKNRIAGPRRPNERAECEVIMMCGLPAVGKTAWVKKHAAEKPDKRYNILGIDNLVEKTGDIAVCQKQNPSSRDVIIDKCNRALDELLDVAGSRRRNYILDQGSNVYASVQKRKMRYFCDYQRKAVVMVLADEEYSQRLSVHDARKKFSDSDIMELKANFITPSVGEFFDTVEWVGLNEEESKKLIEKYNKEGKEAGFGQQQPAKRARLDKNEPANREIRDSRNNRDIRDYRDRRNNYQDRGGRNPPWRGGNNMGGWRGDRPQRGGYMRHSGGYGPPVPWRMRGRGGPLRGVDRRGGGIDRRQGNDRNRPVAARQGNWGHMSSSYQGSQQSGWGGGSDNWSGGQTQGSWSQQGWGQQQWGGSWKGYGGQGTYSQAGYSQQQGYGNGNWNNWNQQYYNNQYWGQQQQSGQTTAAGSQAEIANETVATTDTGAGYSYSQGWQSYTPGRTTAAQSAAQSTTQQSHSHK
ncbi:heterogeneous nuclear ribonucleoprotein U-like protein 1 isoform X3 [Odontomachus brunneus]|uniref:heterogeneous nuclear ribonucleoprotein U-like protein 1 isoform X3 n=1 Tax=Odontomachus brunneus TaxID=486640 RepID=UPI0013F1D232|nr:heterogeneous nuclear ribonucleoprotein U-like protein 1 isoform X3 [Odontomachus brunneus]